MFIPSATAARDRLDRFLPYAGREYATLRNYDDTAHVSTLSPYLRHRMITEPEVLCAVVACHGADMAAKFVQEVFWRTYWKGWLERRPSVWVSYRADLATAVNRIQTESGLRQSWQAACMGQTGIDGFDHWARQLVETGYLHNHARMWFASIWIFTLRLPWVLGADFFLRHLLDGDPASNTLSWRWVGGLQTLGKTYVARAANIAKYTRGQFRPDSLAKVAPPLDGPPHPDCGPPPVSGTVDRNLRCGLLITEEDLSPDWLLDHVTPVATAVVQTTAHRSPLIVSDDVTGFVRDALRDCAHRLSPDHGPLCHIAPDDVQNWARDNDIAQIVTSYIPQGPTRDALKTSELTQVIRPYDAAAWPHATHGFFRFKKVIPELLDQIGASYPC